MNNIVFCFSGTGNSLFAAKNISKTLENCEIVSMTRSINLSKQYDSIGFVYPTYYWGMPKIVIKFIESLNLENNKDAYYYSIATYGGLPGNAIYQLYEILETKHNVKLHYGQKLKMFANYVIAYDMSKNVGVITNKSTKKLLPIINSIKLKKRNRVYKFTKIFKSMNENFVKNVSNMDKNYSIDDSCNYCFICVKVCPVKNIEIIENKPIFKNNCEQCVACIQFCPQKAINYKDLTQKRKRYTNPEINYLELFEHNNKENNGVRPNST